MWDGVGFVVSGVVGGSLRPDFGQQGNLKSQFAKPDISYLVPL